MNNYLESKGYFYSLKFSTLLTMSHSTDLKKLSFARKKLGILLAKYIENKFFKDESIINYTFYKFDDELLITSTKENLINEISNFGNKILTNEILFNLAYNFVLKEHDRKRFFSELDIVYDALSLEKELPQKTVIKNKTNKL